MGDVRLLRKDRLPRVHIWFSCSSCKDPYSDLSVVTNWSRNSIFTNQNVISVRIRLLVGDGCHDPRCCLEWDDAPAAEVHYSVLQEEEAQEAQGCRSGMCLPLPASARLLLTRMCAAGPSPALRANFNACGGCHAPNKWAGGHSRRPGPQGDDCLTV